MPFLQETDLTPEKNHSDDFLTAVFDAIQALIFVVDSDVRIIRYNAAAARLFASESSTILGHRAGDVLHCLHSREATKGCGQGHSCSKCVIRNSVNETFKGNSVVRKPHTLQRLRNGKLQEIHAQVSAFPFQFHGSHFAVLIVDSASEPKDAIPATDRSKDLQDIVLNVIDRIDAMVAFWNHNQVCVFANAAYYNWLGKTRTEVFSTTVKELLGPLYEQDLHHITAAYEGEKRVFERTFSTPEGIRHCLVSYIPYFFGGYVCGIFVHTADVTPLKKLEQSLQIERWRLSSILSATNVGTWEWNIQTGEIVFSQRWAEIVGYTLEELQPISIETWRRLSHPDDLKDSDEQLESHFQGQSDIYEFEGRMKHKNGHWVWVLNQGKVFTWTSDGNPLMMFGSEQDVTQRKEREIAVIQLSQQLEVQATNDSLTGLLNRRGWEKCIIREEARTRRHGSKGCIIVLDLDGLKKINDTHGHKAGDDHLRRAARCLGTTLRDVDQVSRIGGDEFAILVPECSEETARTILKRLEVQFSNECVSASWGVAAFDRSTGIEAAQKMADKRMYEMKARHRTST